MATFKPYDPGNSETELHRHAGETVTRIGEPYAPDPQEPDALMQKIQFSDGTSAEAFIEELS